MDYLDRGNCLMVSEMNTLSLGYSVLIFKTPLNCANINNHAGKAQPLHMGSILVTWVRRVAGVRLEKSDVFLIWKNWFCQWRMRLLYSCLWFLPESSSAQSLFLLLYCLLIEPLRPEGLGTRDSFSGFRDYLDSVVTALHGIHSPDSGYSSKMHTFFCPWKNMLWQVFRSLSPVALW